MEWVAHYPGPLWHDSPVTATRGSWWTRWPDEEDGPLWVGLHLNERAGEMAVVGVEVWTEPPGAARSTLGPAADGADDLLPFPPTPIRSGDVRGLGLDALLAALRSALRHSDDDVVRQAAEVLQGPQTGRPRLYPADHFPRVAGVYLAAVARGSRSPTMDVARAWSVSRSAAGKWVARARAGGHLPPAER